MSRSLLLRPAAACSPSAQIGTPSSAHGRSETNDRQSLVRHSRQDSGRLTLARAKRQAPDQGLLCYAHNRCSELPVVSRRRLLTRQCSHHFAPRTEQSLIRTPQYWAQSRFGSFPICHPPAPQPTSCKAGGITLPSGLSRTIVSSRRQALGHRKQTGLHNNSRSPALGNRTRPEVARLRPTRRVVTMVWPGALHASGETVHRRFVQVKEKRCFFTDTGKGPLVVILASQLVLSRSYRWTAEVLSKNFRVVVAEMPGSGNSDCVRDPWSNSQYAEWISDFLTALNVDEAAALVGHSDSGAPALEAAVRYPNQIKNLILVDSIGANAPDSLPRLILMRVADAFLEIRFSVPGLFHAGKNALFHTRNWLNQIRISAVYDLTDQAKEVKVPTLLAWGRRDKTIPLSAAGTFFRLIPNSHVYISDDGSHNWLIQRPEEFCQAVTDFVNQKDKTTTFTLRLASGVFQREKRPSETTALAANRGTH